MKKKSKWLYRFEINREVDKKVTEKQKDEKTLLRNLKNKTYKILK